MSGISRTIVSNQGVRRRCIFATGGDASSPVAGFHGHSGAWIPVSGLYDSAFAPTTAGPRAQAGRSAALGAQRVTEARRGKSVRWLPVGGYVETFSTGYVVRMCFFRAPGAAGRDLLVD